MPSLENVLGAATIDNDALQRGMTIHRFTIHRGENKWRHTICFERWSYWTFVAFKRCQHARLICVVNKIALVGLILHSHCVVQIQHTHPHLHKLAATYHYVACSNAHCPPALLRHPHCSFVWVGMDPHDLCSTSCDGSSHHHLHSTHQHTIQ